MKELLEEILICKKHMNELLNEKSLDASHMREVEELKKKFERLSKEYQSKLTPWDRVLISRHPERPHTLDYISTLFTSFTELHGDRLYGDDLAIVGGFGYLQGKKCVIIGQEKGKDTETRLKHNFGMPYPEGYRKALRLMELGEKFHLPIITFIDTPGASPMLAAEERGQGWAIAKNLWRMSHIETPIVAVILGEGASGGAIGIGVADRVGMLEHAYYSVITPEGCASILWKDASMKEEAAKELKMQSEDLLSFGIIDEIIKEPIGGAHLDPPIVFEGVKCFLMKEIEQLEKLNPKDLIEKRYQKFRKMGEFEVNQSPINP